MPLSYPKLNFPPINIRAKREKGEKGVKVWSSVRGCYLTLTPEEWVRRHLVEYLHNHKNIPLQEMVEEYPVPLNGQAQRADLVVLREGKPLLLVECKAPDVKMSQETLAQAVRYNSVVKSKYIILTNGITHLCVEYNCETDGYTPLDSFPEI